MITQAELKELVSYNPETGIFTLLKYRVGTTRKIGEPIGSFTRLGYLEAGIKRRKYYLHRLAYLYMTGNFPDGVIDHKNRNKSDNRWCNLACVTQQQNLENDIAPRKHGSLGYRGVYRYKDKFRAKIVHKGRQIHLGTFDTIEEAASAYMKAKPSIHTGFYVGE